MKIEYHADFLEAAIDCCLSGRRKGLPALMISRFHVERERVYRLSDVEGREDAFQQLHLKWFREWGLEDTLKRLSDGLDRFAPLLRALTYRKAHGRKDEGAELYADAQGIRRAVVALRGERFEDEKDLAVFMRHELSHVCDMLDPDFGYQPELVLPGFTVTQQRLAMERYRVLWDAAIDGRLTRSGHGTGTTREKYQALVDQAFSFWPQERRTDMLSRVWDGRGVTHAMLAEQASDPRARDAHGPAPGQPCPLCGMPTFEWAPLDSLNPVVELIHSEFRHWMPEQGACGRCVEVYGAALALKKDSKGW